MSRKIKKIFIVLGLLLLCTVSAGQAALAAQVHDSQCSSGLRDTSTKKCVPLGNGCKNASSSDDCLAANPIIKFINNLIPVISGGIGIVVVGVIIVGGIQYSMAGDKSESLNSARQRIIHGLIALAAFIFMFAFLNWLIPGGIP
jgi:hypothetical protein